MARTGQASSMKKLEILSNPDPSKVFILLLCFRYFCDVKDYTIRIDTIITCYERILLVRYICLKCVPYTTEIATH